MTEDVSIISEDLKSNSQRDARILSRVFQRMSERLEELLKKPVITFSHNKQFGYFCDGMVRIGCQEHHIDHWLEHCENICNRVKAKKEDIENCKKILSMLDDFVRWQSTK